MLVYGEILDFGEVENPYREVRGVTNLFGTLFIIRRKNEKIRRNIK